MKRDIIGDIFLGGVLLSLFFLFSFPVYFSYTGVHVRPVELTERLMSVFFVMAWILTIIWACWKKKVWVIIGSSVFGILAFLPKWFLPSVEEHLSKNGSDLLWSFFSMVLNRIYELVHAPFAGVIWCVGEKQAMHLPEKLLPVCVISYIATNIFRYYQNAFVTERKQMRDFAHFRKNNEARMAQSAEPAGVREAPVPLGTVVMNERSEVEHTVLPGRETTLVDDATMEAKVTGTVDEETKRIGTEPPEDATIRLASDEDADATRRIEADENTDATRRIGAEQDADATRRIGAPEQDDGTDATRRVEAGAPEQEETKVIELAAHAPTSKIEEPAPEENDKTQVIALAAHAPTSRIDTSAEGDSDEQHEGNNEGEILDFPDVRGEAEVIDVFGDDDLD